MTFLYLQVAAKLREQITSGQLAPGDAIPSGRDLAAQEKVSFPTAQKAVALLVNEGWVVTDPTGTYVTGGIPPGAQPLTHQIADLREELAELRAQLVEIRAQIPWVHHP